MEKSKQILVLLSLLVIMFSCEKDDYLTKEEEETLTEINNETISAKWLVTDNNSDYESFEFSENGNYIIVENTSTKSTNDQKIHIGPYHILSGLEILIVCQDFGILEKLVFGSRSASFTVTADNDADNKVAVNVDKAEELEESPKTKLLARSWVLTRSTWYDAEDGTTSEVEIPEGFRAVAAFTYYGTYTTFISYNGTEERAYNNWMWADDDEMGVNVWGQDQSYGDAQYLTISTLTQDLLIDFSIAPNGDIITEYFSIETSGRYW